MWSERGVLNPFAHGFFAFQMFSHKLLRWLVPLALLVALASNALLLQYELFRVLFALQLGIYGLALLGNIFASSLGRVALFYVPAHFCAINAGALLGFLSFISGRRYRVWKPTSRR